MTRTHRSIPLAAAAVALAAAASSAQAQWGGGSARNQSNGSQFVMEWRGNVDRETLIYVSRSGVDVRGAQSRESDGRIVSRGTLPRGSGTLYVQRVDGRGSIDVIRQPSTNGEGVIRIRDPQGGDDRYAVRVYWQPTGGAVAGRRDGDWDRRDDRADRSDRRADRFERQAEKFEEKAERARRKADRKDDRGDRRRRDW
jgi:hypothetical protein